MPFWLDSCPAIAAARASPSPLFPETTIRKSLSTFKYFLVLALACAGALSCCQVMHLCFAVAPGNNSKILSRTACWYHSEFTWMEMGNGIKPWHTVSSNSINGYFVVWLNPLHTWMLLPAPCTVFWIFLWSYVQFLKHQTRSLLVGEGWICKNEQ